jgi:hypothetical protein
MIRFWSSPAVDAGAVIAIEFTPLFRLAWR